MQAKSTQTKRRLGIDNFMVMDPEVYHGELTFKAARVPGDIVLTYISKVMPISEVPGNWPGVTVDAVQEALVFAREALLEKTKEAA